MHEEIMGNDITGYPSIDRPWLKYYSEEALKKPLPDCTAYDLLWQSNMDYLDNIALSYFGNEISFRTLFANIDKAVKAFSAIGVKDGDIVMMISVTTPEIVCAIYALNRLGAIPNMVDPRTGAEGIKEYIVEANSKCILVLDAIYDKVKSLINSISIEHIIIVSSADSLPKFKKIVFNLNNIRSSLYKYAAYCMSWNKFIHEGKGTVINTYPYSRNKCCLIVHTGGTTGMPKASCII